MKYSQEMILSSPSGYCMPFEERDKEVAKKDRTRETYYNYFTFGNWGMASNYDLCVDSSILGIEGTADLIIEVGKKMGIIR